MKTLLIISELTLSYWSAAFPGLARNTREIQEKARDCADGTITREQYDHFDSMKRNELSNVSQSFNYHNVSGSLHCIALRKEVTTVNGIS